METCSNLLLIAGSGQNTGKTTLACEVIKANCEKHEIAGIKISPHFHLYNPDDKVIFKNENFIILEETSSETGKDSSRMLKAGARKSFFIMSTDGYVLNAFRYIINIIPNQFMIVCEAGGLANYLKPGLFLYLSKGELSFDNQKKMDLSQKADRIFNTSIESVLTLTPNILIVNNRWILKET